jgi:hypothetical protein
MDLCILAADDVQDLEAERQRVAEEFRAQITSLGMLRGLLTQAPTVKAREQLHAAIEDEHARFGELGDKLLHLEAWVSALRDREACKSQTNLF